MCLVTYSWKESDSLEKVRAYRGRPTWANVELTEFCNFDCKWCYAAKNRSSQGRRSRIHMPIRDASRLIKIFSESGIREITCSGGEPLMYPHIRQFIKEATDCGIIVHMNTNGYFFTKKLARELHDLGLTQIQTNIDSLNPRNHDAIRGKTGSFVRSVSALKNARNVGMSAVCETVITKQSIGEISDIMKFARMVLGVQKCRVWDATPSGAVLGDMDMVPERYPEIIKAVTKIAEKLGAKGILSYEPFFPDIATKLKVTQVGCPVRMGMLVHILPNGDVPYCVTARNHLMYNVFDFDSICDVHAEMIKKFNEREFGGSYGCASRMISNHMDDYQEPCLSRGHGS